MLFNSYVEILNIIYKGVDGKKREDIGGITKERIKYEKCLYKKYGKKNVSYVVHRWSKGYWQIRKGKQTKDGVTITSDKRLYKGRFKRMGLLKNKTR